MLFEISWGLDVCVFSMLFLSSPFVFLRNMDVYYRALLIWYFFSFFSWNYVLQLLFFRSLCSFVFVIEGFSLFFVFFIFMILLGKQFAFLWHTIYRFSFWLFFNCAYSFPARLVLGKGYFYMSMIYWFTLRHSVPCLLVLPFFPFICFFFFLLCFVFTYFCALQKYNC